MTYEPHYAQTFAGIDRHASGALLPRVYKTTVGASHSPSTDFPAFQSVLTTLSEDFGIASRPALYYDTERAEVVEVPNRKVLVNPAWLGDGLDEAPQNSAAWTTASDSYTETDAMDNYGPLVALARRRDYTHAFGHVRAYRNGGDVHMDVFFPSLTANDPEDDSARYVLGFETGYDYFRSQSVTASVAAFDTETGAILRGLSKPYSSPHRGDIKARTVEWFDAMLDRAETVSETLYEVVAEARNYTIDLTQVPLTVADFYEGAGLPPGIAAAAAERVSDTRTPSAWDLYEPLTVVLTREYGAKVGGSALTKHASRANDLLYSPASTEQSAYRRAAETDVHSKQSTLGDTETAADVLLARATSLDEAVERSVSFRERIKTMLEDAPTTTDDEDEDEVEVPA